MVQVQYLYSACRMWHIIGLVYWKHIPLVGNVYITYGYDTIDNDNNTVWIGILIEFVNCCVSLSFRTYCGFDLRIQLFVNILSYSLSHGHVLWCFWCFVCVHTISVLLIPYCLALSRVPCGLFLMDVYVIKAWYTIVNYA